MEWGSEMGASVQLTRADNHALEKMPSGWFEWYDVPAVVRCPEYRCRRIVEKGLLKRKLIGKWPDCHWVYKKTQDHQPAQEGVSDG